MEKRTNGEMLVSQTEPHDKFTDAIAVSGMANGIDRKRHDKDAGAELMLRIVDSADVSAEQILMILRSDEHLAAFKDIIRYNDTEWDVNRPSDELVVLLRHISSYQENDTLPVADMTASEIKDVRATSAEPTGTMERADVVEKYDLFRQELNSVASTAGNRFSNPAVLSDILAELKVKIESMLHQCEMDISTPVDLNEVEHMNKQKLSERLGAALAMIDDHLLSSTLDVVSYAELFPVLSRHKKLYTDLRKLAFALTFQRRLPLQNMFTKLPEQPTINAVEQIDYFINEEVVGNVFKDAFEQGHIAQKFRRMCKTGPIEKEMHNQAITTGNSRKIQFIPTKGALRELAAYIGDSCYTLEGELMAEKHPNVTAIIMKQINRGNGEERFVGSSLLIDTTDTNGDKVAVIRALNPIENIINKLSVSDFYNQFVAYVKSITEEEYAKVGIVIDNRAGGAATNRPLLFNYLKYLRDNGALRPLAVNKKDTTINGFDISDKVFQI